jgi:hypothetical protein
MSKKTKSIPFQLVDISTEQFATFRDNHTEGDYEFAIDFSVRVSVDKKENVVGVFTKYQFDQEEKPVLVIECGCHFSINEDYWNNNLKGDILTVDKGLLTHLLVLTVGTSRGVLHAKKPKWLDSLLLPTLNVASSITDDFTIDLSVEDEEE